MKAAKSCHPDVFVTQRLDAGGHGLKRGAVVIKLLSEAADASSQANLGDINLMAGGGIVEGRGVASCVARGPSGAVMGTRFLACEEATIARGYQSEVLQKKDCGVSTVRSTVYGFLRSTTDWPERYDGRVIFNRSYLYVKDGVITAENKRMYVEA